MTTILREQKLCDVWFTDNFLIQSFKIQMFSLASVTESNTDYTNTNVKYPNGSPQRCFLEPSVESDFGAAH